MSETAASSDGEEQSAEETTPFIDAEPAQPIGQPEQPSRTDRARSAAYRSRFVIVYVTLAVGLNISIGMYTPPFGFNLFVTMGIFHASMRKIVTGLIPFIAVSLVALLLTTYIPWLSLWLPRLLYPNSFR